MLNQTKLSIQEIQQVWKAIKEITRLRSKVSQSALEIARKAGWDENIMEMETRVKTAISALEEAGYLKRGQNMPRLYASSIRARNAEEAIIRLTTPPDSMFPRSKSNSHYQKTDCQQKPKTSWKEEANHESTIYPIIWES